MKKTLDLSKLREDGMRLGLWLDASAAIMEVRKSCSENIGSINEVNDSLTNINR